MQNIEFFERTTKNYIKNLIKTKVENKLKEYDEQVEGRQAELKDFLGWENARYDIEFQSYSNNLVAQAAQQRLDGINMESLHRKRAEAELMEMKQQQLKLEGSEDWRHMQSKELLLETKKAELYQIAEKKQRQEEFKAMDRTWHQIAKAMDRRKEAEEIYEVNLRQMIEQKRQMINQQIQKDLQQQQQQSCDEFRKAIQQQNQQMQKLENEFQKAEENRNKQTKLQQNLQLKLQIEENRKTKQQLQQTTAAEDQQRLKEEEEHFIQALRRKQEEELMNTKWYRKCLQHHIDEKQKDQKADQTAKHGQNLAEVAGNACTAFRQSKKQPYNKAIR